MVEPEPRIRAQQPLRPCRLLDREPAGGATLYAAACVAALRAKGKPTADSRQESDEALSWLRQALQQGYGRELLDSDDDLAGIRQDPRFRALQKEALERTQR